jgi:hypothetical protein
MTLGYARGTSGAAIALLPETTITTAVTGQVPGPASVPLSPGVTYLALVAKFDWGSGGTSAKCYVQTSLDNGATWMDVASFAFTTADGVKRSILTTGVAPAAQAAAPTDGTLADDTVVNGVIGSRLRVKVTTTGTYAGSTTLAVWATPKGR